MKIIRLDYEDVEVGRTAVKTIEIWNESCKEELYQVQRDPTTNPLDHTFHLRLYTWTLAPDEKFLCEIRYRPLIPFSKNVDYFVITDTSGVSMKIIVHGSSIGPVVSCSTTKIFMYCTTENPEVKRRIKLVNNSKVAATFMFSMDEKFKPFQLDTRYGVIRPCSRKYITIKFSPPKEGRYTYHLAALFLYHEPIIIELHGSLSLKKEAVDYMAYPWREKVGFKGYMREVVDSLGDLPPISLSKHYFNFGQADVDTENIIQRIPYAICLTNHSHSNLLISWEKDDDGNFSITPSEMIVRPGHSTLFELTFNPNIKNNLFGREIVGSVFLVHVKMSTFPFVTSITVIGHSFPVNSNGWIPQYNIPQTVIMPPCVPPFSVYTTFLIKKFGHLPLMFQFVSPTASHFTVKPMLGVIYQDYQIITVEMASELKDEQIYIERWTIYFNGNTKNESYIDFKGYAEYANIVFNNKNVLNFPPVLPNCQQFAQLEMRNVTRHKIMYQFYQLPSELGMQWLNGEIGANDSLVQECYFSPSEPNIDYEFEVKCVLIVIKSGATVGSKCCINLCVRGKSRIGSLEAVPKELNFEELEYNANKTLSFDLVNSSSVNIYYKLTCTHLNMPLENIEEDVKLHPLSETIFSGSRKKITVSITPHTAIYYQFAIQYLVRINFRSDNLVPGQTPIKLCSVYCMCILPTIKVQNVCAFGHKQRFSLNVSKPFLWRALQINRLNKELEYMLPGEKKIVNIDLFPMLINEGTVLIKWIVINPSRLPVPLVLKRIKQCSCEPVVKKVGLSLEQKEMNCVHEDLCIIYVKPKILKPKEQTVITMNLRYALVGKIVTTWDLDIGHDRHIILNVIMDCLPETDSQDRFLSTSLINFGKVYFGNREGMYRVLWICNITDKDLPYSVDISNIRKVNENYQCEVFSCLTLDNIVKARSARILLVKFQPRMFGAYEVALLITMGEKTEELILKGESSFDSRSVSIGKLIPSYCACKTPRFPAYFSIDCIDMWCIPTHTFIVKMLLIYNNLDYAALAYEWNCQDVSQILYVDIFPRKGIMSPNVVQSFRVKIYTKGYPCRMDVNIPCIFFNASKRRLHQRSIIKHTILSKELEGQFTITEKGISVPKPWIKILNKPEKYHKTLALRCSIYSIEDEGIKISLLQELKAAPLSTIYFDNSKNTTVIKENEFLIVTFILEHMLWDIVNSRRFKKMIEESLIPHRDLYYSQFTMGLAERKRLVRRSFISPPLTIIDQILEQMLFIIVHEEFSLKLTHLIPNEDVRHRNYLKMLPRQKKFDLEKNPQEGQDERFDDDNTEYLRTGFRVSFAE